MEGARIITLVDTPEQGGEVTFEQAFGEHSEWRGRGRARRHKRRMERIANRGEEQEARGENKQRRKNKRKSGKIGRRRMKKDAEREDNIMDAENEKAVSEINPEQEESTGSESSSDDSGEEQTPAELDQNSEAEDTESEFEAGSTDEYVSSFDSETSEAAGSVKKNKKPASISQLIAWNKRSIKFHQDKIAKVKALLSAGKLPSNEVAKNAKELRTLEGRVQKSINRIAELEKKLAMQSVRPKSHLTPVKRSLNATMSPNKIEVPAKSSADGDFNDAEGDDFLGFDAKETIKKNKNVLIGVGVAATVIIGLHVAGVFKK